MDPIIYVDKLTKRYKKADRNAVDDVSFAVEPGAFFTLLGPNGAGKTTTIAILTTTLSPTSGDVFIDGHDLRREASEVRRSVGIIFQRPSLDMNLTAEENVRFHTFLYGLYPFRPSFSTMPHSYKERVRDLAGLLGIEQEIFKPIRTFSGGMMRKLEIVRSLIHQPRVLFLDEPTTGLDPASRRNVWEYLRRVRRESGTTVFLTTHYLEEAEEADTVCIINRGRIIAHGSPTQVKAELTDEHLLIDSGADLRPRLRAELERLQLQPMDGVEGPFKLPLNGQSVHSILRSIETPLTMVVTHTPTLEDAYLAIVAQEQDGA